MASPTSTAPSPSRSPSRRPKASGLVLVVLVVLGAPTVVLKSIALLRLGRVGWLARDGRPGCAHGRGVRDEPDARPGPRRLSRPRDRDGRLRGSAVTLVTRPGGRPPRRVRACVPGSPR